MTPPTYSYRLSIDLSDHGQVLGASWQVRSGRTVVSEHVLPAPTPDDTPIATLATLMSDVEARYGVQLELWP